MKKHEITVEKASQIKKLVNDGIDSWVKAGGVIVELVEDGVTLREIADITGIPVGGLSKFEALGRRVFIPELILASYPAGKPMMLLPYSEQKKIVDGSVDVLQSDGKTTLRIMTRDLTSSQCGQVFTGGIIRSKAQQKAYLDSRKTEASITKTPRHSNPYDIVSGELVFKRGCRLTKAQLALIMDQMED